MTSNEHTEAIAVILVALIAGVGIFMIPSDGGGISGATTAPAGTDTSPVVQDSLRFMGGDKTTPFSIYVHPGQLTADILLTSINSENNPPLCNKISAWTGSAYKSYSLQLPKTGKFPIEAGRGYLIKCSKEAEFSIDGKESIAFNIPLKTGFNLVGTRKAHKGRPFSEFINGCSGGYIAKWNPSLQNFDVNSKSNPTNTLIDDGGQASMILCTSIGTWDPTPSSTGPSCRIIIKPDAPGCSVAPKYDDLTGKCIVSYDVKCPPQKKVCLPVPVPARVLGQGCKWVEQKGPDGCVKEYTISCPAKK